MLGGIGVALAFGYAWSWVMAVVGLLVRTAEAVQAAVYIVVFRSASPALCSVFVPARTMPGRPLVLWATAIMVCTPVAVRAFSRAVA